MGYNGIPRRLKAVGNALQAYRWEEITRLWPPQTPKQEAALFGLCTGATTYHMEHGGTLDEVLDRFPATLSEGLMQLWLKESDAGAANTAAGGEPRA